MADNKPYMLWCFIEGNPSPFPVTAPGDANIGQLKDLIWGRGQNSVVLKNAGALDLVLWKLTQPELIRPSEQLPERIALKGDLSNFVTKMELSNTVVDEFPEHPSTKHLHVIAQVLHSGNYSPYPPHKRPRIISPPHAPATHLIPRINTVVALYKKLNSYRFIQVRGTPASGKTTLAELVSQHIKQQEPRTNVIWIQGWTRDDVKATGRWKNYFEIELGWDQDESTVFVFDEAQMSYDDGDLWNNFFKSIHNYKYSRAIAFSSYGSASSHFEITGTPMFVQDAQRVTLRPIQHNDNLPPAGLFFTQKEFDALVSGLVPIHEYCFDRSFLDGVYYFTKGHVGATYDLIKIILAHDSYCATRNLNEHDYTWDLFMEKVSPGALVERLEKSASLFMRGLPPNKDLQHPSIARIFSSVLSTGVITDAEISTEDEKWALLLCFRKGWLHSDKLLDNMGRSGEVGYVFSSPLHRWYIEWKLQDTLPTIPFNASNILEFIIGVIAKFSSRKLSTERRIDSGCIQQPPEAQYQDEFYRCCHAYSNGSLHTFPEYGMKGRIDFYIPSKQWGVELLREGNQLVEHCGRFSTSGKYAAAFNFSDYIILDCRATKPRVAHPGLRRLYHVVFSDSYRNVRILDNRLKLVDGGEFRLLG